MISPEILPVVLLAATVFKINSFIYVRINLSYSRVTMDKTKLSSPFSETVGNGDATNSAETLSQRRRRDEGPDEAELPSAINLAIRVRTRPAVTAGLARFSSSQACGGCGKE